MKQDPPKKTLSEMTSRDLVSSAQSELAGLCKHLDMAREAEWDNMPRSEKLTRGYLMMISARLMVLGMDLQDDAEGV